MGEHLPEELFGQGGVAVMVSMGEVVAGGRSGAAQGGERAGMQAQGVADVIEAEGVGGLREEQRDDMAPGTEGAGLLIHLSVSGQWRHEKRGDETADLPQDRVRVGGGGARRADLFMPSGGGKRRPGQHLFIRLWDGCGIKCIVAC